MPADASVTCYSSHGAKHCHTAHLHSNACRQVTPGPPACILPPGRHAAGTAGSAPGRCCDTGAGRHRRVSSMCQRTDHTQKAGMQWQQGEGQPSWQLEHHACATQPGSQPNKHNPAIQQAGITPQAPVHGGHHAGTVQLLLHARHAAIERGGKVEHVLQTVHEATCSYSAFHACPASSVPASFDLMVAF